MPHVDLSNWTWEEIQNQYPEIYRQYGPGSQGYVAPPTNPTGGTRGPTNLPGSTERGSTAYGEVPQVPNPVETANRATEGNLANLGNLQNLARQTNEFNAGQAIAPYVANLPNYTAMVGQNSENILNELQGIVPPDVWAQLQQRSAERGVMMGSPGSANSNAALLAALGLTSLDLQKLGSGQLGQAIAQTPVPQQFYPQSQFVSPEQQQAAQAAANVYASAPDPELAAREAERRAQAGIQSGQAAVGPGGGGGISMPSGGGYHAPAVNTANWWSAPAPQVYSSSGTGMYYGGQLQQNPPSTTSNWWNSTSPTGALQWQWDNDIGAYVNSATGQISDNPGNAGSVWGLNWDDVNTPAQEWQGPIGQSPTGAATWQWDNEMGGYVNTATGDLSDYPGGPSWGNYDDANAVAEEWE